MNKKVADILKENSTCEVSNDGDFYYVETTSNLILNGKDIILAQLKFITKENIKVEERGDKLRFY